MSLINSKYFESKNVKVYPAAFRGNYTSNSEGSLQFDPESRMPTEYNLLRAGGFLGTNESYIISWVNNKLTCVIGGYYFEISNVDLTDFVQAKEITDSNNLPYESKYLVIKYRTIELKDTDSYDLKRETTVLLNQDTESAESLDQLISGNYAFTGISITNSLLGAGAYLVPITVDNIGNPNINYAAFLPKIECGLGNDGGDSTNTGVLVNSIQIGENSKANGRASFASGLDTQALGNFSTTSGGKTVALNTYASAEGEGSITRKTIQNVNSNSILLNDSSDLSVGQILKYTVGYNDYYYKIINITQTEGRVVINDTSVLANNPNITDIYVVKGIAYGSASHSEGYNTTASGIDSHAEGTNSLAAGEHSHAEGNNTKALQEESHAEGKATTASGIGAHAEGANTYATATGAHAEGFANTTASGLGSHAEGNTTIASNRYAHSEGDTTIASGAASHAEGEGSHAEGEGSHAEGLNTQALSNGSHAEGGNTIANGINAHAEGQYTKATNEGAHAEGGTAKAAEGETQTYTLASGLYSHAEGEQTTASNKGAHAEGFQTVAEGEYSHASGISTEATAKAAHAEGSVTNATEEAAHAEGSDTYATAKAAHAEGKGTQSNAEAAHAEGNATEAYASYSHTEGNTTSVKNTAEAGHAEGYKTIASGAYAHAEGESNAETENAQGQGSHSEGFKTQALKEYSHAEGKDTIANGVASHVEGVNTQTSNEAAHAEGKDTIASGVASHAEGELTVASGKNAHAEGCGDGSTENAAGENSHSSGEYTQAIGKNSTAAGLYTVAQNANEFVVGKYNEYDIDPETELPAADDRLFVVGNGKDVNHRSNAFEVLLDDTKTTQNGCDIKIGGISIANLVTSLFIDNIYPVGAIYTSTVIDDGRDSRPNTIEDSTKQGCPIARLGGEWQRIEGRFLLGAGTTSGTETEYEANSYAGSADLVTIKHSHGGATEKSGAHQHYFTYTNKARDLSASRHRYTVDDSGGGWYIDNEALVDVSASSALTNEDEQSAHTHNFTTLNTYPNGSSEPTEETGVGKNMPPYLVVYMWKRTK